MATSIELLRSPLASRARRGASSATLYASRSGRAAARSLILHERGASAALELAGGEAAETLGNAFESPPSRLGLLGRVARASPLCAASPRAAL